jgi:hypothetical protein
VQRKSLSALLSGNFAEADLLERVRRSRGYQSVGALGALGSTALIVISKLVAQPGGAVTAILLALLTASLALVAWTRLWLKESKEPFQYTYSVGAFAPMEGVDAISVEGSPIRWLTRDLTKMLSERVHRLSYLDEEHVPAFDPDGPPASHVRIGGWYGLRRVESCWELEVVPEVRLGGVGAPAKLARAVRLKLSPRDSGGENGAGPPDLTDGEYGMLFERIYWSVASQIYAQIHRGVEAKVQLLPRGSLRAAAYVHEADDYATSNTLDSYEAAQKLYRLALEVYEIGFRERPATPWRLRKVRWLTRFGKWRCAFRRARAQVWRRAGRREVMAARAELGLARMLVAEWHLRRLCGMIPREIFEAASIVEGAIERLSVIPDDIEDRETTLFRARVTKATIRLFLRDRPGAKTVLRDAERLVPGGAREDAEFLFAAGMVEPDRLRSLRLLGQAVELNPMMERALFYRAQQCDEIWRRRPEFEPEVAELVDAEYRAVIALNPGNLSAWARRGYLGWLLAGKKSPDPDRWRKRATDALEAGRQYKEVRQEATVAELDWTMARLFAEDGEFARSYERYIGAVSARLANPAIDFEKDFHLSATDALVERFREYRSQVRRKAAEARRESTVSKRLISSVMAFVDNDCGLVHQAHYDRTGRESDLLDAKKAFAQAHEANRAFVLPAFNLARLHMKEAEQPGRSSAEKKGDLRKAEILLGEVLRHERDWAPARLLMVEAQAELAKEIERLLWEAERDTRESGLSYPVAGSALAGVVEAQGARKAREKQLQKRRKERYKMLEANLRHLLPHAQLGPPSDSLVDVLGTHVDLLVDEGKQDALRWTKDFSELHVAALVQWVKVLVVTAPSAADRLGGKLRQVFYRADTDLLRAQCEALQELRKSEEQADDQDASKALANRAKECKELFREVIAMALDEDPVNFLALKRTVWLRKEKRLQVLDAALKASPSAAALVWVGDALSKENEDAGAMRAYREATSHGELAIARVAWLRLGGLEENVAMEADALSAYREAAQSSQASIAAEALAGATRLLLASERTGEARSELRKAAARSELALHLGLELRRQGRREEAIFVYREALKADELEGEWRARLRLQLGLALIEGEDDVPDDARDHLRAAAESDGLEESWQAAVILARTLVDTDPEEAQALYRQALEESDPTARGNVEAELKAINGGPTAGAMIGECPLPR